MKKEILTPVVITKTKSIRLCLPKLIVFLQLLNTHGANYFESIRNWDKEKNKLLEAYGYSLSDELKGKFEFAYKDGKPFLRVLDANIKRVAPVAAPTQPVISLKKECKGKRTGTAVDVEEAVAFQTTGGCF